MWFKDCYPLPGLKFNIFKVPYLIELCSNGVKIGKI